MTRSGDEYGTSPGGLAARLRRMTEQGALGSSATAAGPHPRESHENVDPPEGWRAVDAYTWHRRTTVKAACRTPLEPSPLFLSGGDIRDLVFFDMETTGLSGGAGTLAFLIGLGTSDGQTFEIDQFFLRDYPGEHQFLDAVLARMDSKKTYVSYNGKAFDAQILKTRCVMAGREFPVSEQIDLLYSARRLWKDTLPSCSLKDVEEHVLGFRRSEDVPGILIPDIYFDFLRTGAVDRLQQVFAHHLQDVVNLERLLAHMTRIFAGEVLDPFSSGYRLGRLLVDAGFNSGFDILAGAFRNGDVAAGFYLAGHLKRRGEYVRAAAIWNTILERDLDLTAAFELAKYAEHKIRDFHLAESFTERILSAVRESGATRAPEPEERLLHRLNRIRRKAGRG